MTFKDKTWLWFSFVLCFWDSNGLIIFSSNFKHPHPLLHHWGPCLVLCLHSLLQGEFTGVIQETCPTYDGWGVYFWCPLFKSYLTMLCMSYLFCYIYYIFGTMLWDDFLYAIVSGKNSSVFDVIVKMLCICT